MAGIEKRIADLERLCEGTAGAPAEREAADQLHQERVAKMKQDLERVEEKAAREEAEGDSRRRHALETLYESMRRRADK